MASIRERGQEAVKIVACLNSLFPPFTILQDDEDFDPSPCSSGLRDSIRFSVFEHLMGDNLFSEQHRRTIQMKLLCWCDVPGYVQARDALLRYSEESKKLEEVCFNVLDELDRRPSSGMSMRASSADSSILSFAERSMSPEPWGTSSRKSTPEFGASTDPSIDSRMSAVVSPESFSIRPNLNPLLKGMPGRELSAAKTDTAAFAGDLSAPPILTYPEDLSTEEFYQHPLAQDLEMSSLEKAILGLLVPKELKSRDF